MDVEIHIKKRTGATKGETGRLRADGMVPAVIYAHGKTAENICLNAVAFDTVLRNLQSGFLPTTIFSLVGEDGKKRRAIIKDIQYQVTTYKVIHLDFLELQDKVMVEFNVPVECLGQTDCVGVKAGGFLRSLMRHVKVRCLPAHIPSHFEIDVRNLGLNQVKRTSELAIPAHVQVLARPDDVIVTVVKR
jgi:large subunit ribosomal protein L25